MHNIADIMTEEGNQSLSLSAISKNILNRRLTEFHDGMFNSEEKDSS